MRATIRWCGAIGLLICGYALGASGILSPADVQAQPAADELELTTIEKYKTAYNALQAAGQALQDEGRYVSAIEGVNSFAITVGGVNAVEDLETGRGVDPETFAGLYAGRATDDIAQHLARDAEGRLTYKNRVVRIYPISRLQQMFAERDRLAGLEP